MISRKIAILVVPTIAIITTTLPHCVFTLSEKKLKALMAEVSAAETVTLEEEIFNFRTAQTGLWNPCKFNKIIGFGIFPTMKHNSVRLPVLLLHGHADEPKSLKKIGDSLDRSKFEPVYGYYASGQSLDALTTAFTFALQAASRRFKWSEMVIVAYSMSGLFVRKFLGLRAKRNKNPRIIGFIAISTPWGGVERAGRWAWSPAAPPSWVDMKPGSRFLKHLFDKPLPETVPLYILYSLKGGRGTIAGADDTVISFKSATRPEALKEAAYVEVFPECNHRGIVRRQKPVSRVVSILNSIYKKWLGG